MKKGFGDLFGESWKEYKFNFWVFFKIFLVFSLIPLIIFSVIGFLIFPTEFLSNMLLGKISGEQSIGYSIYFFVNIFIVLLFYFMMSLSYFYLAIFKQKSVSMNFGQAFKGGMKYFWRYIGLSLLLGIFLIPLFLLFIIPGLIFLIYWTFSSYILMRENTGIWESMKRSKIIVKGKWWGVFGYLFILGLITIGISFVFNIPAYILGFFLVFSSVGGIIDITGLSLGMQILLLSSSIISSFGALIVSPLTILFGKNFYLNLRTSVPKAKKK